MLLMMILHLHILWTVMRTNKILVEDILKIQSVLAFIFIHKKKELVVRKCNFIISILNEPFFELNQRFNKEYQEILGERYEETIERLKNGDRFYFFQKGTGNKLILCGQDLQDISYC